MVFVCTLVSSSRVCLPLFGVAQLSSNMASHLLIAPLRAGLRLQQRINTPLTIPAFKRCLATNATTSPLHLALSTTTRAPIPPIGTYSRHLISKLRSESAAVVQFSRTLPSPVRNKYYGSTRSGGGSSKGFGGGGGFFSNLGRYIDRLPSNVIFYGILAVNGAVFLLWSARRSSPSYIDFIG